MIMFIVVSIICVINLIILIIIKQPHHHQLQQQQQPRAGLALQGHQQALRDEVPSAVDCDQRKWQQYAQEAADNCG